MKVKRLHPAAVLPRRAHPGDAGLDLCCVEAVRLEPGERTTVPTGLALEIPEGHAGWVLPRSGLAARHGIALVNAPGLIDADYRGELCVLLLNTGSEVFSAEVGERIAQLVVTRVELVDVEEVDELLSTDRGSGGFGSSGR